MACLRCTVCANNYPVAKAYRRCPVCEEKTDTINNVDPMPDDEARSIKRHADFERYYEERQASGATAETAS